jgi:hypothetical protein
MTMKTVLQGILRRWYVVLAGLLITAGGCVFGYTHTGPIYQRSASELLVPGTQTVPQGGNPFLYLGGLSQASDVLVRALTADNLQRPILEGRTDVAVDIARDVSTSGPILVVTVNGPKDADVSAVFESILDAIPTTLSSLQAEAEVPAAARITVLPVTVDTSSSTTQKSRFETTAVIGAGGLAATLLLAALIDGLVLARRRARESHGTVKLTGSLNSGIIGASRPRTGDSARQRARKPRATRR